jgi:hypothetical protein
MSILKLATFVFFALFFAACSVKPLEPIVFLPLKKSISYYDEVKPILDKRCVSCHSCYNSPCQLKLSSYDGLQRGASKIDVYANRLKAIEPTRLFIDANTPLQWRQKGFSSVLDSINENSNENNTKHESIMMYQLYQKMKFPKNIGTYAPETDTLSCVKNKEELEGYFEKYPHKAMPYGFPAISYKEYSLIQSWLVQGSHDDTPSFKASTKEQQRIVLFENFLNHQNMKHQVSARYIYEHLFLAHISLDEQSHQFYELVRSKTPYPKPVQVIPTRFVFSSTNEPFYYRLQPIESTIVHKTHMVYEINEAKIKRYKELFIDSLWDLAPHMPSYEHHIAANALKAYEQIPAKSRYLFLLDDIHFFIMTFIRGPVCKGQIALNVIQDHFWVMFLDPQYDLSVQHKYFLHDNIQYLHLPNEEGNNPGLIKTFSVLRDYSNIQTYFENKTAVYKQHYTKGLPLQAIWRGNHFNTPKQNDAILTIYRHFDSASVHKGAWGNTPKTMWVIDYSLLERLYYSLVAGFDIFGNTAHQLLVRKYMDLLRIEGENSFLSFLPIHSREDYFNHWYKGWDSKYYDIYPKEQVNSAFDFTSNDYKKEFSDAVLNHTNTAKDSINYIKEDYKPIALKKNYESIEDIEQALQTLTLPNHSKIIQHFRDGNSNLAFIQFEMNSKQSHVYTLIVNCWLDNVAFLFDEESRKDSSKDNINFIKGFFGSYPNLFVKVQQNDLYEFFDLIQNYDHSLKHQKLLSKFVINRAQHDFWTIFDWFDNAFKKQNMLHYGLFDLNRYTPKAHHEDTP